MDVSLVLAYKEKVKPAPFGLKEVMEMRPVTFKWKERDEKDFGLVAEDMEKINPLCGFRRCRSVIPRSCRSLF